MEAPLSERFRDLSVADFLGRLASADPVPGGGSASAVAASTAASLVAMVAALSIGRPKYAEHEDLLERTRHAAVELAGRTLALADEDSAAYGGFAAAMKMPRDTDVEKAARSAALHAAATGASEVPLEVVEACRDIVGLAESLAGRSNANASSDLGVAALLSEAAARGAAANVLVNLPSIGDEAIADGLRSSVEELLEEVVHLASQTREVVASGDVRSPLPRVSEPG